MQSHYLLCLLYKAPRQRKTRRASLQTLQNTKQYTQIKSKLVLHSMFSIAEKKENAQTAIQQRERNGQGRDLYYGSRPLKCSYLNIQPGHKMHGNLSPFHADLIKHDHL